MPTIPAEPLLTRNEAAALLGLRPQTLADWSCTGRVKLPHIKLSGRAIRYRRRDLERFITERTIGAETPD